MKEPLFFELNGTLPEDLKEIARLIEKAALGRRQDSLELLALLRLLEYLHREIRDSLFRDALPENRQQLYALLRDIEMNGGWPYIHRMKLRSLLEHMLLEEESPVSE
ncbi:MAG TPA: hypothetical protein V6D29_25350 [Leptolyngbyaceae cyanobacterium]